MTSNHNPDGCLTALFKLVGVDLSRWASRSGGSDSWEHFPTFPASDNVSIDAEPASANAPREWRYRRRDDFLSAAERSFYGVLETVVAGKAVVFVKVRVADLLYVPGGEGRQGDQNRIDRKHVDFVLCTPDRLQPLAVLELDDASHSRRDRIDRDDFLDAAFQAAGLPLLRVPAQRHYDPKQLAAELDVVFNQPSPPKAVETITDPEMPLTCPQCGDGMILRTAAKGPKRGQTFYGCRNYPRCSGRVTGR